MPLAAPAQQSAMPVIGYLGAQSADDDYKNYTVPFLQGLQEAGHVVGQNIAIEYLYAEGQFDRLPALAADLVRHRVAVIVAVGNEAALAAKGATATLPIVFFIGNDPVALGLVASLNRPGANVTGATDLTAELAPKRLQLLRDLIPNATLFGVLVDPAIRGVQSLIAGVQAAARTLGLQLVVANASTGSDLETAFASFSQQHVGAVMNGSTSTFYNLRMGQLAALAARHALPVIYSYREYALAGGLFSYGSSLGYAKHQAGIYTGRILKGEKPADLPVMQPTKFDLVINLKTAKALGLTVPETLLATADEVIRTCRSPASGSRTRSHAFTHDTSCRQFIAGLGSAAAWPVVARAQQRAVPVIGFLDAGSLETRREYVAALHRGLSETGYFEGRNLAVEYRWAEDRLDRLPALAADLVRRQVAVIFATPTPAAVAAKAATKSIPIVFTTGADPVEIGLVASLNRPGGNLTGMSNLVTAVAAKRLALLHELMPAETLIAYLVNPTNPVFSEPETKELQDAARTLGVRLLILKASDPSEFEAAFATLIRDKAGGLVVSGETLFWHYSDRLVVLAARYRVPAGYGYPAIATAGGLMSYGTDFLGSFRQAGVYAGRILKGEKPADLPVQQVAKIEMVINLKTAKALGLTIPETLLATADEVIQ